MDDRLQRPRAIAFGVLGLAVLTIVPEHGWWPVALLIVTFSGFAVMHAVRERIPAPEYLLLGSWAFAQLSIAVAIAMTGGSDSFALSWLIVPIVTLPARFNSRGVAAGIAYTAVLMLVVTVLVSPGDSGPDLYGVIFPIAGLIAAGMLSTALMHSDVDHRTESVIDGLTGMLNRRALEHRLEELEGQAAITKQPIAVIAGDLDHFKNVNDAHGHATGDAVLVDTAYLLRKQLRAFDLAYRVGGEEFLVLLPGATVEEATRIAEGLREAVASSTVGGLEVTMSFGVAGSAPGHFERSETLAHADQALYEAKRQGRDRVVSVDDLVLAGSGS